VFKEYGFTGTVFIITGFVGKANTWDVNLGGCMFRHLSWSQIGEMHEAGFEIGSHTIHHPDLTRIKDMDWLNLELIRSKADIEAKIGEEVRFISFPFGRYNNEVIGSCKKAGYDYGCGFILSKRMKKSKEKFLLERKPYYLFDGQGSLKAKLGMSAWTAAENAKLRMINFCSHASSMVKPATKPRVLDESKNTFT
jgi:peptidoglycan/xylan/chitin deacetylase (PgdA/CDA1 family)